VKFLCVCNAAHTRSVACANALKRRGQNAIAAARHYNVPEPMAMLSRWADRIILMYHWEPDFIPASERRKVRWLDVGHDVWHDPTNPQLVAIVDRAIAEWEAQGYP
jgi:hypothetical protein